MKNQVLILFISALLFSCGEEKKKETVISEPVQEQEVSIQEEAPKKTQKETINDVTSIPNYKENLLLKIQEYILSKNVLESQRPNIVVKSVSMNDDCSEMKLSYELKYEKKWWGEEGETNSTELIDQSDYLITIDNIKSTEEKAKVELHITKDYLENELNYYGEKSEIRSRVEFSESEIFELQSEMNFEDNKISTVFNAIRGRKVKREELLDFTLDELDYLRNEFYARKGYQFKTERMQNYFSKQQWYTPTEKDLTGLLDNTELTNVFYIKAMAAELEMNASTDEKTKLSAIYKIAQTRTLKDSDLEALTAHQMNYLRNEFYARKGYIFKSVRLAKYFSSTSWYQAELENVDDLLSDLEKQNIQFIKSVEKAKK